MRDGAILEANMPQKSSYLENAMVSQIWPIGRLYKTQFFIILANRTNERLVDINEFWL